MSVAIDFTLARDAFGRLLLTDAAGSVVVVPVRAFPLGAPDECLSLVGTEDGRERAWLARLDVLPSEARALVEEDLAGREFMPEIQRLLAVSTYATPSTWEVETDRGPARLVLKSEDDLRRLPDNGLLVLSGEGLHFRIRDRFALDRASRRMLDRFL
ncbi:DUF1854 domain-containing protein [Xylophilus sp. GW821-FHT01B05]